MSIYLAASLLDALGQGQTSSPASASSDTWTSLWTGFVTSMVAGIILVVCTTALTMLLSRSVRLMLTAALCEFLKIDVKEVFRTSESCLEDTKAEISRAGFVYLLTGRGNELAREKFNSLLKDRSRADTRPFRVLLPAVTSTDPRRDWTAQREKELAAFDTGFTTPGVLRKQIEANLELLAPYAGQGQVEVRLFQYPHVGRILITDRVAYFTPYQKNDHGRNAPVIKYRRDGYMYDFLARLFDQLWDTSEAMVSRSSSNATTS